MNHFAMMALREAEAVLGSFVNQAGLEVRFDKAVGLLASALQAGIPVISCGNGGSTCDAMHLAQELVGRYCQDRPPLPAMAISDPSYLTCAANDFGFEEVFARQVAALGREGGVLVAISTSGDSTNVLKAAKAAWEKGMQVIGLTGQSGGQLEPLCQVCFKVPSEKTDRIQEVHIKIVHNLIYGVEKRLFPSVFENS